MVTEAKKKANARYDLEGGEELIGTWQEACITGSSTWALFGELN